MQSRSDICYRRCSLSRKQQAATAILRCRARRRTSTTQILLPTLVAAAFLHRAHAAPRARGHAPLRAWGCACTASQRSPRPSVVVAAAVECRADPAPRPEGRQAPGRGPGLFGRGGGVATVFVGGCPAACVCARVLLLLLCVGRGRGRGGTVDAGSANRSGRRADGVRSGRRAAGQREGRWRAVFLHARRELREEGKVLCKVLLIVRHGALPVAGRDRHTAPASLAFEFQEGV